MVLYLMFRAAFPLALHDAFLVHLVRKAAIGTSRPYSKPDCLPNTPRSTGASSESEQQA